ncbi:L-threonine 3-dehydrogenase [Stella humosa]|uniref:L-threonine 3-dehydrogenase n=1 Tax=Stella humosa TaxID=94 RepID=A0A3N1L1T9_9PROT|nr:alcohol dehydrogenase catalytic domain-containing protein [Stella humosa]ROP84558.1 L-threonine 3-dehydrogenase [Stella humosa]BBK34078.1 S-(hydroxymethyl)glutathione dehydrogenase [Stella humosa]
MIQSRAAVCHSANQPMTMETVEVEGPKSGEVLIEIKATGVCHTDAVIFWGINANSPLPAILGHEGAGVVVEVGPDVETVRPGDHVVPLYGAECGTCRQCRSGRTNICWSTRKTRDLGVLLDGTARFRLNGQPIHHFMGTSTFSRYTVVPEVAVARIRSDLPLAQACLLGCGVTTGVGAAMHDVRPGDTVAVFGLGGVGVNIVQGARAAGAARIIGIDPNPMKRDLAARFGATDLIDPVPLGPRLVAAIIDMTDGGVDVSFESSGELGVMRQAFECTCVGWGTCVLLGVEPDGAEIGVRPVMVRYGRTLKGSYFGGVKGRSQLGRYADMLAAGTITVDGLVSHTLPIDAVNEAFELMRTGQSSRAVLLHA